MMKEDWLNKPDNQVEEVFFHKCDSTQYVLSSVKVSVEKKPKFLKDYAQKKYHEKINEDLFQQIFSEDLSTEVSSLQ